MSPSVTQLGCRLLEPFPYQKILSWAGIQSFPPHRVQPWTQFPLHSIGRYVFPGISQLVLPLSLDTCYYSPSHRVLHSFHITSVP